ncbi:MAG TPA: hypothetical protein PLI01_08240 [Nitrospira sp.]|nr:hypothetical protein [Nitrospira sp.]
MPKSMTGRIETSRASSAQTINWKAGPTASTGTKIFGRFRLRRFGRPDCEYGDQKHHDFWLANHWRIVEITTSALTVMNMCGREETLDVEGIGTVKGEPASATVPARAPSSASLPPHIVDHTQGMWGKSHKIHYDDQCNGVHFVPNEPGKETKVYRWDAAQQSFVNEHDPTDTKTPGQLEKFAGVVLKEYIDGEWQGTNCGDMPRWAL